jgi:hypothetical protein
MFMSRMVSRLEGRDSGPQDTGIRIDQHTAKPLVWRVHRADGVSHAMEPADDPAANPAPTQGPIQGPAGARLRECMVGRERQAAGMGQGTRGTPKSDGAGWLPAPEPVYGYPLSNQDQRPDVHAFALSADQFPVGHGPQPHRGGADVPI